MADIPALLVPVHLDALVLPQDRAVVDATADFTRLPYSDGVRDVNSDAGYLSESLVADPFANQDLRLPAGVHLHWALPDALTRATGTASGMRFPLVPDRWLVVRHRAGVTPYERAWVVDSRYLHPPGSGPQTGSAAFPVTGPSTTPAGSPPSRRLGRVVPLESWAEPGPGAQYLDGLTAVGYGEPTFAAFYPNCRNVFGMLDDDLPAITAGLTYDVVGWYTDPAADFLHTLLAAHPADPVEALARGARGGPAGPRGAGWAAGQALPDRTVCFGRLAFTPDGTTPGLPDGATVTVTVANSGAQALCAYLGDTLPGSSAAAEEVLEAVLLAPQLSGAGPDQAPQFVEAVHESGFAAVNAGSLWTLTQQPGGTADARQSNLATSAAAALRAEAPPVLDRLAHALNALNAAQQDYDRATDEIGSAAGQLFADWYRYVLCAYPPAGTGEDYPDIDAVRRFVERAPLADLSARLPATGLLERRRDADGRVQPVDTGGVPGSRSAAVMAAAATVQAALDELNAQQDTAGSGLTYRLQQVDAARYWQPVEPAVLLAGEAMAPALRHGQDGRMRADGLLGCPVVAVPSPPSGPGDAASVIGILDALAPPPGQEQIGYQAWTSQDWHALLLSWQVEFLPALPPGIAPGDRLPPAGAPYPPDQLTAAYALADDEPELRLRAGQGALSPALAVYSGTSILTPYARQLQQQRLASYVLRVHRQEVPGPALSPQDAVTYLADPANLAAVRQWLAAKPPPADGSPGPVATALAALQQLQAVPSLSQSLGGFTEALLTRRQTLQLEVADPLGFDDYRGFTDTVHAYVHGEPTATVPAADLPGGGPGYLRGHNRAAPVPGGVFQPIRSGALRLLRLRLLDAFGRTVDLTWDRVVASRLMPAAAGDLIALPPRLVPPARLDFRWLSADLGDAQLTDLSTHTPICGWILPNHLEQSLALYTTDGAALGSVDATGRWQHAPGTAPVEPGQIPDEHLQRLVTHLLGRTPAFLADLHGAIDSALAAVDPPVPSGQHVPAQLIGRPLAVARASLNLELQGLAAVDQSWNALRRDLRGGARSTRDFAGVRVPVRIGDYRRLDDGLVGYWLETDGGYEPTFYAPLSEPFDDPDIATHAAGDLVLAQSPNAPAQTLTMLIDPRGSVHATCGLLPVKSIDIPVEQYRDALARIAVTVSAGPLLSDPRTVEVPLPLGQEHDWSWVEQEGTGWRQTWTWPVVERQEFLDTLALELWRRLADRAVRWLEVLPGATVTPSATVVPAAGRAGAPGPWPDAILTGLEQVLAPYPDGTVALAEFAAGVSTAVGAGVWDRLTDPAVGWLTLLDPSVVTTGPVARVTVGATGTAAAVLPDPLTGTDDVVRAALDLARRRIVPPVPQPGTGTPRQLREGWLALRGLDSRGLEQLTP